jgi:hypothetical protein
MGNTSDSDFSYKTTKVTEIKKTEVKISKDFQ